MYTRGQFRKLEQDGISSTVEIKKLKRPLLYTVVIKEAQYRKGVLNGWMRKIQLKYNYELKTYETAKCGMYWYKNGWKNGISIFSPNTFPLEIEWNINYHYNGVNCGSECPDHLETAKTFIEYDINEYL